MRLKSMVAAAVSAALACALSVSVCAADGSKAVLGAADTLFSVQDFKTSVTVTGDGQYSLETNAMAGAEDIGVLTVTIEKLSKEHPDASARLDRVEIDGRSVSFRSENVRYGDLNGNGDYRIELIDQYSDFDGDPAIAQATHITKSLKLTFTVSGYERAVPANAVMTLPDSIPVGGDKQDGQDKQSGQSAPAAPDKTAPDTDTAADGKQDTAPKPAETEASPPKPAETAQEASAAQNPAPPKEDSADVSAPMFSSETPISDTEKGGALSEIAILAVIIVIAYKKKTVFLPFLLKKH